MQAPGDVESPPPYGSLALDDETANRIEKAWARMARDPKLCVCGRECTQNTCAKHPQVFLGFQSTEVRPPVTWLSRLLGRSQAPPAWRAILIVFNRNVAGLMRKGLSFSSEDIAIGQDTISLHGPAQPVLWFKDMRTMLTQEFASSWGEAVGHWPHRRKYVLLGNRQSGTNARAPSDRSSHWFGHLIVLAHDPSTIIDFDIKSITNQSTVWGLAFDSEQRTIFDTRGGPTESFNSVFPGLLQWWTCPGDQQRPNVE